MGRIVLLVSILIFFFLGPRILFAASDAAFAPLSGAVAQESSRPLVIASASAEIKQTLNYDLPYPGILPDNPLYVLKVIRDKIVSFLISSSLKKGEFNLLQADKRLNAGVYLFNSAKSGTVQNPTKQNGGEKDEKKINLAISTISKAENYFHEAISEIRKANNQGINTRGLTEKLLDASKKHQEIISSLEKRSKGNTRESLARENKRVKDFEKQVSELLSKKS